MTKQELTNIINALRLEVEKDAISPENVGYIMQQLLEKEDADKAESDEAVANAVSQLSEAIRSAAAREKSAREAAVSEINGSIENLFNSVEDVVNAVAVESERREEADDALSDAINLIPHPISVKDTDIGDLVFADESENPILTVKNGHIKTAKFDSANIKATGSGASPVTVRDISNADLVIADEDESPLLTVSGGHVSTSGFSSYEIVTGEGAANALSVNSSSSVANNVCNFAYRGINRKVSASVILRHIDMARSSSDAVGQSVTILAGQIDQRGWLVNQHSTAAKIVSVSGDVARIKPSSFFVVNAGDFVFVSVPKYGNRVAVVASEQGSIYNVLEYGTNDPSDISVNYRTDIRFEAFNLVVCDFSNTNLWQALKSALDDSSQALSKSQEAQSDASAARYLQDVVTGRTYRLQVSNGVLGVKSVGYHEILVLGNSFTNHPEAIQYGFKAVRGMAASTDQSDYCAYLAEGTGATITKATIGSEVNCVEFERHYSPSFDFSSIVFDRTKQYDLIVVQLTENAGYSATMQASWEALYQYLKDLYPEAPIVQLIGWDNAQKTAALSAACNAKGVTLLNVQGETYTGSFSSGAYNRNNDNELRPMADTILTHPSDIGMLLIANRILSSIGLQPLDYIHMIDVVAPTGSQIFVMMSRVDGLSKGAFHGIVTLSVTGASSVQVTDSDNNEVAVVKISANRYTFVMPNKAVTVRGVI